MELDRIYNMDCLEGMKQLPDASVDCIITDLPYGTTANKWDSIIPFDDLWRGFCRLIKPTGAIVLFSSGEFTHKLIKSMECLYRYKWIWVKNRRGNFVNAKNRPMTAYEEILIFSQAFTANGVPAGRKMIYNPQGLIECHKKKKAGESKFGTMAGKRPSHVQEYESEYTNYPCDVLTDFPCEPSPWHPTQKPVSLIRYLIRTYTNTGGVILDACMGSGTTAIAAIMENRHFVGYELDPEYYSRALKRIKQQQQQLTFDFNI